MSIFEAASRLKARFNSPKGPLSTEDLWELPLTSNIGKANLDDIARELFGQLKGTDNISFVNKEQKADAGLQLRFDVVKRVIDVRVAENEVAATKRTNAERKQRILALIENKENEALGARSVEELRAEANAL